MTTQSPDNEFQDKIITQVISKLDCCSLEIPVQDISENQGLRDTDNKRASSYANISYDTRYNFVQEVNNTKCTIKCAAKKYKINFSTAKAIMQIYRREGRIGKKQRRETRKRLPCSSHCSQNNDNLQQQNRNLGSASQIHSAIINKDSFVIKIEEQDDQQVEYLLYLRRHLKTKLIINKNYGINILSYNNNNCITLRSRDNKCQISRFGTTKIGKIKRNQWNPKTLRQARNKWWILYINQ